MILLCFGILAGKWRITLDSTASGEIPQQAPNLASEIPHQAMLCFELLSIGRAQMQNKKSDVRNMTMWVANGRKNRKKQWFIAHATCAVFVAFWFPWLQMTKPAHSPRIWSNYTVDAPEILHTHSWYNYNINYALIILRGSFELLHMLRAAICSLCFALSFHFCLPQFLSLSLSVTPSVCSKPPPKMPPPWLVKGNDSAADILTTTLQTLLSSVLAVEPCIVHISWLVMGRTTQIACCDESSDHVRYTVWSLNVGFSGRDVIGCRLALPWNSDKNILSGRQFNYIL